MSNTIDLTFVAQDRTSKSYTVALPAGIKMKSVTARLPWALNAAGQAVFSPSPNWSTMAADQAHASYTADGLDGSAEIKLIFPVDIMRGKAQRDAATSIDLAWYNPLITEPYKVSLNPTSAPRGMGTWGARDSVVQFIPAFFNQTKDVITEYTLTFADGRTSKGKIILFFVSDLVAGSVSFDIDPTQNHITLDCQKNWFATDGIKNLLVNGSDSFTETDSAGNTVANWSISGSGDQSKIILDIVDRSVMRFSAGYSLVDKHGKVSEPGQITVRKPVSVMPLAGDVLVAAPVPVSGQLAVDVLSKGSSFFAKDETSVVLLGIQDIPQDYPTAKQALLQKDGKVLRVPLEGVWLVDDQGLIAYQAEPGITRAPTPVAYRFSDVQGNQSNSALIILNPNLSLVAQAPANLAKQDEATFWGSLETMLGQTVVLPQTFIGMMSLLAGITRSLGVVGDPPVSFDDFNAAYAQWQKSVNHKHPWYDASAKTGLLNVCDELVNKAIPHQTKIDFRARYWRLNYMADLAAKAEVLGD